MISAWNLLTNESIKLSLEDVAEQVGVEDVELMIHCMTVVSSHVNELRVRAAEVEKRKRF